MNNKVDEIEATLATARKHKTHREISLSSDFTARVMADVRVAKQKNAVRQETAALRVSWLTFAVAALVMLYFGITFEQTNMTDELLSVIYVDDSVTELSDLADSGLF